jgi:hypothetical protein
VFSKFNPQAQSSQDRPMDSLLVEMELMVTLEIGKSTTIEAAAYFHQCFVPQEVQAPIGKASFFTQDRVRVLVAHFGTIHLALNSTFQLNCQQKLNFWAAGRQKFTSLSTLLYKRKVPSLYCATTVAQLCAT